MTATTADPVPGNNTGVGVDDGRTGASADLAVTKTGTATVTPGGALTYTVTVTNIGPSDAAGVTVTDTPGPGIVGAAAPGCTGVAAGVSTRHTRRRRDRRRSR